MGKVFFSVGMSLDGFLAPPEQRADDPQGARWMAEWMKIQSWVMRQKFFREKLKIGEGGETGRDNQILQEVFARTGVSIMGKRMFEAGEHAWPEEAPFETPVFVLTKEVRSPWGRKGGTTFYFVNDGIESALEQARAVAGDRDIRIAGGANVIVQYLNAGLIDEFAIALAPALLGEGIRLFDGVDTKRVKFDVVGTIQSPWVSHLRYEVRRG